MKSKIFTLFTLLLVPLFLLAQPTDEQILASIDNGVAWIAAHQNGNGSWEFSEQVACTGFALTKLCDYAWEADISPFDPAYTYYTNVVNGFDYIFSKVMTYGPGQGLCASPAAPSHYYHHETYNAALALMAVAVSRSPARVISYPANPLVDGLTFLQLQNEMVQHFIWSQTMNTGGGWAYQPSYPQDDNSHTGYVTIALRYAETEGSVLPQTLKDNLSVFIDYIQNDVSGGSGYMDPNQWVNLLKTGNLLTEMSLVGDAIGDTRVQAAIDFIETNWGPTDGSGYEFGTDDPQTMYCLMKGFEGFDIDFISLSVPDDTDWFAEFAQFLVDHQSPDGSWSTLPVFWGNVFLNTCWALLVLEKVAPPPPVIPVDLDIHPTSWPNPLNIDSKGVTPVAVLGTEDFDVSQLDPVTLMLEGVPPLRWAMEDVGTPVGDEAGCNATELGADGIMDLTLKYKTQELIAALGSISIGDELILELTGSTFEEEDIFGDDCVIIVGKGTKSASVSSFENSLSQNYPNPFDQQTKIIYELAEESHVLLRVFSIMGQEVKTIVNQTQPSGQHFVEFNGADLPEGVYFYRLTTPTFNETKIMNVVH